jgi:GTPase SAR1 family protein
MSLNAKQQILNIGRAHLAIEVDPAQQADREKRIEPLIKALSANVFRLVVMGEVKKGKSSFINSLLGQPDLSPTEIDIATSTVYKFVHGPVERVTVFFLTDDSEPSTKEITRDEIPLYGTEAGNPGNAKGVDFIAVELPQPLLAEGVAIVDTPGVGGLFRRHRDITFRYAPEADVVMFVVDSAEAVISEDEKRFLEQLQKHTQRIVFLQTKIDLAGTEQVLAWRKRNLEILSATLNVKPEAIPYFLVGAKLKELADKRNNTELLKQSGYPEVLRYIRQELIPRRDEILARRWFPLLGPELLSSIKLVSDRLSIVRASHQPKLAEYERQLAEAEREFDRWQTDVWPAQSRQFQDEITRLKFDTKNHLQDELSPTSRECVASLDALRQRCGSAQDVERLCDEHLGDWAQRWTERADEILTGFRREYLRQCERLVGRITEDLSAVSLPNIDVEPGERRPVKENSMQVVREAAMNYNVIGGVAGEAAKWLGFGAGIATGFGLISNPIGWAVGAAAGVGYVATKIWAAVRGFEMARERQRDAAIQSLEHSVRNTGAEALKSATRAFERLSAALDSAAKAQIDGFRSAMKNDFTARRQEINQGKARTAAENREAEEKIKKSLAQYQELLASYQEIKRVLDAGGAA